MLFLFRMSMLLGVRVLLLSLLLTFLLISLRLSNGLSLAPFFITWSWAPSLRPSPQIIANRSTFTAEGTTNTHLFFFEFTFSIENGVQYKHLIFHWFLMEADLSSFYLSQYSLMISYCLLAVFGLHRFGDGGEIRFSVFLSRVYPGVSRLSNFSGFASIFCTAEWRHPSPWLWPLLRTCA